VIDVPDKFGQILIKIGKCARFEDEEIEPMPVVGRPRGRPRTRLEASPTRAPPPPLVEEPAVEVPAVGGASAFHDAAAEAAPSEDDMKAAAEQGGQVRAALLERAIAYGLQVDANWTDTQLRARVEAARRARYLRRDMRPEE
jgi:hypothetical protein